MVRIAGIDIPSRKKLLIALTYIFGIGQFTSKIILKKSNINVEKRTHELTDKEITNIKNCLNILNISIEGDLRKQIYVNIKRLLDIRCYRGIRHRKNLPTKGQRTHSNAKTAKKKKFYKI